jgi:hypothetical protein
VDAIDEQVPNIQRELTSSFGTKLPREEEKCREQ